MPKLNTLEGMVFWIAVITVVSGATQMLMPQLVLGIVGAETGAEANHFFAIVGMFMVLFGGLLIHGIATKRASSIIVLWCGLQKLGAAIAVGLGVFNGVFGALALAVAGFDLFSALLFFAFATRLMKLAKGEYGLLSTSA